MLIGLTHINARRGRAVPCRWCKGLIAPGDLHAMVVTRWGKAQANALRLAVASGRAWSKKAGLRYRRLHLGDCLSNWFLSVRVHRTEYRREHQGRPPGTGQLSPLPPEDAMIRRRLVRRRAEVIRQIAGTEDEAKLQRLVGRFVALELQLDIKVIDTMVRRSPRETAVVNAKIRRYVPDGTPE